MRGSHKGLHRSGQGQAWAEGPSAVVREEWQGEAMGRDQRGSQGERKRPELGKGLQRWRGGTVMEKFGRPKASVAGGVGDMEYCPVSLPCGYGTITKWDG